MKMQQLDGEFFRQWNTSSYEYWLILGATRTCISEISLKLNFTGNQTWSIQYWIWRSIQSWIYYTCITFWKQRSIISYCFFFFFFFFFFSHFCGAGQSRANNRKRWHNINLPSGGCYFWWRPGRLCSAALDTLTLTTMKHVRIGHHPAVMPCCFLYLIRTFVTCFSFTSLLGTVLRVTISCSNSITSLIIWLETKSCRILPLAYGTKYDMT